MRDHFEFGDWYEGLGRAGCLLLAVALGYVIFRRLRNTLRRERDHTPDPPSQPSINWLQKLQVSAANRLETTYDEDAVRTFVALITEPTRHRSRVAESITLEERVITQHVSVEFALPRIDPCHTARYLPLLAPMKGQLVDNFRLTDAAGKSLVDLSFDETTKLAAAGLRLLLLQALDLGCADPECAEADADSGQPTPSRAQESQRATAAMSARVDTELRGIELSLLGQLARRGAVSQEDAAREIDAAFALVPGLLTDLGREQVREYVLPLSVAYPIVAVVPTDAVVADRTLLHYERALIPASLNERGSGPFRGWHRGLLRIGLGIKPFQISLPVLLASTAASYHLRLNGPPNKYVRGQQFRCRFCKAEVQRTWEPAEAQPGGPRCSHRMKAASDSPQISDGDRHFRIRPKRGQSFVHLYLRGFGYSNKPQFQDLELFAQFKEAPPGSRAVAVVTALACTTIVGVIGRHVSQGADPQNSLVAILLALPAAAASWFGFAVDRESLVGSSLLARLSQLITAAVSFTAITIYFTSHDGRIPLGLSVVGITEPLWVILFLLSVMNLIYISYRFALKFWHYNDLVRKKERQPDGSPLW
jgi:hypothetical protein